MWSRLEMTSRDTSDVCSCYRIHLHCSHPPVTTWCGIVCLRQYRRTVCLPTAQGHANEWPACLAVRKAASTFRRYLWKVCVCSPGDPEVTLSAVCCQSHSCSVRTLLCCQRKCTYTGIVCGCVRVCVGVVCECVWVWCVGVCVCCVWVCVLCVWVCVLCVGVLYVGVCACGVCACVRVWCVRVCVPRGAAVRFPFRPLCLVVSLTSPSHATDTLSWLRNATPLSPFKPVRFPFSAFLGRCAGKNKPQWLHHFVCAAVRNVKCSQSGAFRNKTIVCPTVLPPGTAPRPAHRTHFDVLPWRHKSRNIGSCKCHSMGDADCFPQARPIMSLSGHWRTSCVR